MPFRIHTYQMGIVSYQQLHSPLIWDDSVLAKKDHINIFINSTGSLQKVCPGYSFSYVCNIFEDIALIRGSIVDESM